MMEEREGVGYPSTYFLLLVPPFVSQFVRWALGRV